MNIDYRKLWIEFLEWAKISGNSWSGKEINRLMKDKELKELRKIQEQETKKEKE